jgi:hypothetical protein
VARSGYLKMKTPPGACGEPVTGFLGLSGMIDEGESRRQSALSVRGSGLGRFYFLDEVACVTLL